MNLLADLCLCCAAIPFALTLINLPLFRRPRAHRGSEPPRVSVLIPARDEEANISAALQHLLRSEDARLEIIVCDDHSTDRTASIVRRMIAENRSPHSLSLISADELPAAWNGKQHACWQLALAATAPVLCWIDADVRVTPIAVRAAHEFLLASRAQCASGFPREQTHTMLERLLLPLIHFVLLGYLPLPLMRATRSPAFAAGCGQFMLAHRDPYFAVNGHAAIAHSRHDGIMLPRIFRRAGYATDIFDASALATCRMYEGAAATWNGLLKNAHEGMAAPRAILPFSLLLLFGQVLPLCLLPFSLRFAAPLALGYATRALCTARFSQSWLGCLLHPLSVFLLLAVQWQAFCRNVLGTPVTWRSRSYRERG